VRSARLAHLARVGDADGRHLAVARRIMTIRPRASNIAWRSGWLRLAIVLGVVITGAVRPAAQEPIASIGLTAGWATFGQALPQGAAVEGVQVGTLPTQTDVKNRWADGSIRFAIVTVYSPSAGTYAISPSAAGTGTFVPSTPTVNVTLTIGGVPHVATLPSAPSADTWLSGPLASEWRAVVAPVTSQGAAHPFLRVNFDTRAYNDGKARVDVSVENMLDQAGATTVTYDASIVVDGQVVFASAAVQHYYLTRWRHVSEVGAAPLASVTPDTAPLTASHALPAYLQMVANQVNAPTGANFAILKQGALDTNMPAHGGRPELAPYPDWTARYLVHRNATQRAFVLAHGDLSGSWPVHVREAAGSATSGVGAERLISLDQRPTIWFDSRAKSDFLDYVKGTPMPIREYGSVTPGPGQSPLIPDNAHQPSLAYVPYLLTGDRYYAEEMAFWANYSMMRTYPSDGVRGADGILAYNEVRGYAWALRNMADAATYYPDASPVKLYLARKVVANLQWLDAYANAQDPVSNPFQVLWRNKRPEGSQYIALWEQNYLAYAIDRAHKLGFAGGLAHRDAIARLQLGLFTSEPEYPRAEAAPYIVGVGAASGSTFTYYTTMAQIWSATRSQTRPFAGYYGPEARLNLMIGVEAGWPSAQSAYEYLWPFLGVNPTWGTLPDLAQRAGWAIDFAGASPGPPPAPEPVSAELLSPANASTFTSSQQAFTWNAGSSVSTYRLDIGNTSGGSDVYTSGSTTALTATASGLPTDGRTLRARLSSSINGAWQYRDYTFTAFTSVPPPPPTTGAPAVHRVVYSDGSGARTTARFNVPAGALLVAFGSSGGPSGSMQRVTISGAGLTWTRVRRVNVQLGTSEIWIARTPTALVDVRVRSQQAFSAYDQSLTVVVFTGASGVGASAAASATSGAAKVSLVTTRPQSLVYAVGNDWDRAIARTLGPNQVMVHQWVDARVNDTFWVQAFTSPVAAASTSVTLSTTAPTAGRWNFAAVEIVP
jgi:hypothetical protein